MHTRKNIEGFVLKFVDQSMVKVKTTWYCNLHKLFDDILHDRSIMRMILESKTDDPRSFLTCDKLNDYNQRVEKYETILSKFTQYCIDIDQTIDYTNSTDREIADQVNKLDKFIRPILFTARGKNIPISEATRSFVMRQTQKNKVFDNFIKEVSKYGI